MKKTLLICFLLLGLIVPKFGEPYPSPFSNPTDTKKEIRLTGSFRTRTPRSLTLSPIEATISTTSLDIVFLQDLGGIDIEIYSESGNIVYSESVDTQTQQYLSIDVSAWNSGIYQIRFVNSDGNYVYGTFEIGL
jgi:hypothetical protein